VNLTKLHQKPKVSQMSWLLSPLQPYQFQLKPITTSFQPLH